MHGSKKSRALTREQFEYIVDAFGASGDLRMECLCMLLGRCIRIGDVVRTLKIADVYTTEGKVRGIVGFHEEKTGKWRTIQIPPASRLYIALSRYNESVARLPRHGGLFYGAKTGLPLHDVGVKSILAGFVGLKGIEQCSPHSFRKYGAKFIHQKGVDIETISHLLNHSSVTQTRTYLDILPKEVERADLLLAM